MTLQDLLILAEDRDLSKSYPKADGVYIWDYKLQFNQELEAELVLIPSDSGKAGFKDKVSIEEIIQYVLSETDPEIPADKVFAELEIVGVEGITVAKV